MPQGSGHQADDACTAGKPRGKAVYRLTGGEVISSDLGLELKETTMAQLGHCAGIAVGAAVIAVLKD